MKWRHGRSGPRRTRAYVAWQNMISRANPNGRQSYKRYGRTVTVCERWRDFNNFLADMGEPPFPGASLDRIDNEGNYEPSNCRWATQRQQNINRRMAHILEYGGERMSLVEWAEKLGIHKNTLWNRLNRGWSLERALTAPKHR